jgi:type III pantothenate kinase
MLLTIDVGNTNTVLGLFEGDQVVEHWRIATDPQRTADEIVVVLQGLLAQSAVYKDPDISGIALCSTVPSVLHEMRKMCRRYYPDIPALIVEPGVGGGGGGGGGAPPAARRGQQQTQCRQQFKYRHQPR